MISRYQTPEMSAIWSEQRKFELWQQITVTACEVRAAWGEIPAADAVTIRERAAFEIPRILEIEAQVEHDVIAFLTNLAEHIGPAARHLHGGMTSSDLLDTALALQLKESGRVLEGALGDLLAALERRAQEHRRTVMAGRSHGVHAEPTTFGLKLLVYWDELRRGQRWLAAAFAEAAVGKLSGAVGTLAHLDPAVETETLRRLALAVAPVTTQVVQRDRHAHLLNAFALVGAVLEQIAIEIRNLQRTDVHEVEEPFGKGQKGSSAMPHKKNPIVSERLTGMARLLRAYAHTGLENVALWHERDISHSSVERVIFPDACHVLHYMLRRMTWLVEGLVVHPARMLENLARVRGLVFSQTVLLALVRAGATREEAYAAVQRCAMRVWECGIDFRESLLADAAIVERLGPDDLARCFDLDHQLRHVDDIFARTLANGAAVRDA